MKIVPYILKSEDVSSGQERLEYILKADRGVYVEFEIGFLPDDEWDKFIDEWLGNFEHTLEPGQVEYIRNHSRGLEQDGVIFIKNSAKKDEDFRRLLLHELGHAIGLNHVDRDGDIMNSDYRKWYGVIIK